MNSALAGLLVALSLVPTLAPEYSIEAIRYATVPQFPVSVLVVGAPADERLDIALVFWLIRGSGRVVLYDAGFYRPEWFGRFAIADYVRPDEAVRLAGIEPGEVTDIVISHAHWDHLGGIELFPRATVWIQKAEYEYYTGAAWQESGRHGGIDPADILHLVQRNTQGLVRLVDGDDVEVLPGIRVYTGARHTYASQYVRVAGAPTYVLASDNCYLYRNLETLAPVATFDPADRPANLRAFERMVELAGGRERVVPGHDPEQFRRFPTQGRIARIK